VKQQFVGAAHDQEVGLSYLAEVEWLRGCKADSTLAVVLKVGFYLGAVQSEAVACRVRNYGVRAGLDDLTTFTNYNMNNWMSTNSQYPAKIVHRNGEFFIDTSGVWDLFLRKSFHNIIEGDSYVFTFDYRTTGPESYKLSQNESLIVNGKFAASTSWQSIRVEFNAKIAPGSIVALDFYVGGVGEIYIDNLRLRKS
ncbi:hypothetical protein DMX04_22645, partial [Pseudomonas koreensis]